MFFQSVSYFLLSLFLAPLAMKLLFGAIDANWSKTFDKLWLKISNFLPIFSLLFLASFYKLNTAKSIEYHNPIFITLRVTIILLVWNFIQFKLQKNQLTSKKIQIYLGVFFISFFIFSWDTFLRLEEFNRAAIYPFLMLGTLFMKGFSATAIFIFFDKKNQYNFKYIGSFIFGFTFLCFYFYFFKFFIDWFSIDYIKNNDSLTISDKLLATIVLLNFLIPFFMLIHQKLRQRKLVLLMVALCLFAADFILTLANFSVINL